MSRLEEAAAKACCADLYQSDLARLILGDTRHPGGLRLTHRLGRLMGLRRDDWVVDLASGNGASAAAISRAFHCRVVGIEYGRAAALEAREKARAAPIPGRAGFIQGDAEQPPLRAGRFDAVFAECSLSLFPDKAKAVREAVRLLRPGGKLGLSDVTVAPGCLPSELDGSLGRLLCLSDALDVNGYTGLLEEAGLERLYREDASNEVLRLLEELQAKLGAFTAWQSFQNVNDAGATTSLWPNGMDWSVLLHQVKELVTDGRLGYWLYVAQKPAEPGRD